MNEAADSCRSRICDKSQKPFCILLTINQRPNSFGAPTMNGHTHPPNSVAIKDELKHPLQRLHSPSRTFSLILHSLGLYSFAKSFEYLQTHPNPINQSYGWHFQYLTILGMSHLVLRG